MGALKWLTIAIFVVSVANSIEDEEYVWMTDPQTQERYQVLRSTYDRDKVFFVGVSTLSNRFSPSYLDVLANQCYAMTGPPSLFEFLNHTSTAVAEFCFNPDIYSYSFEIYLRLFETIRWGPYMVAGLVAVGFTIARFFFTKFFLQTKIGQPFTTEHSQRKAMTPLWNTISYSLLFIVESAILLNSGYEDFVYPLCIFKKIHFKPGYFDEPFPWQYYWLYMFQVGFYIHSFYAALRLDNKRKDTSVILIHHVLTIALLSFSFFARFYRVGLLVLFLHDISDVILESGKFLIALRSKFPANATRLERIANCLFGAFVISWFYLRIYLFPTKVIYATTWGVYLTHLDREAYFFLFFNTMLAALYLLHIYWSYFIVVMLCKKVMGRMPRIEDERDFESDTSTNGFCKPVANGVLNHEKAQ
uniref:TLC domain-containing protein n=1 Tax=Mesocestoides corti TaxID=53468 RepID=A0A5K3EIH3_MESCO